MGHNANQIERRVRSTLKCNVANRDRTDNHGREVASGIYFIEVATPTDQDRKKVVLAK